MATNMNLDPSSEHLLQQAAAVWHAAEAVALGQLLATYENIGPYKAPPGGTPHAPVVLAEIIVMHARRDSPDSTTSLGSKSYIAV